MIKLSDYSTKAPKGTNEKDIRKKTKEITKEIAKLQEKMYAEKKHSILIVFQGMDSSGKDGSSHAVFKYCSPVGISAKTFKKPSDEEFAHDFLWRVTPHAPAKGEIQLFIRSHYEDILIQRVHNWISEKRVKQRMKAINAWEQLISVDNNTTVLKFYLHLSPERQLEKLQERIDIADKNWKHNDGDWKERERWADYRTAYEYAINESEIPWIITPVDQRWYRNYFIANEVLKTMKGMKMKFPKLKSEIFAKD